MKCQKNLAGYTIIEVMLVLIISSALLMSVMTLISGQQKKTQFTTGAREFESKLDDIINDVSTGVFPSGNDLKCDVPGISADPEAAPQLTPVAAGAAEQGTSENCVYLGKAIQFYRGPDGTVDKYRVVTVTGKRLDFNPTTLKTEEPTSLEAAKPTAYQSNGKFTGLDEFTIPYGIEVTKIRNVTNFSPFEADDSFRELAIVPSVVLSQKNNISSNLGNGRLILAALEGDSNFNDNISTLTSSISTLSNTTADRAKKGSVICLRDGAGGRPAAIGLGIQFSDTASGFDIQSTNQQLSAQTFLDDQAKLLGCT